MSTMTRHDMQVDDALAYRLDVAGAMIGCSSSTIRRLVKRGDLDAVEINGALRITRQALDGYVRRCETTDSDT